MTDNGTTIPHRRIFLPLANAPYEWFASRQKHWEVRKDQRQFSSRNLWPGRRVEVRRGYRDRDSSLWGTIVDVRTAPNLRQLLQLIGTEHTTPTHTDLDESVAFVDEILGSPTQANVPVIAFRITLDTPEQHPTKIAMAPRYRPLVDSGDKLQTIRRGKRDIQPGPALLMFGQDSVRPVSVTATTFTRASDLDDSDARADGFANKEQLLAALHAHYPDFNLNTESVTVVSFTPTGPSTRADHG